MDTTHGLSRHHATSALLDGMRRLPVGLTGGTHRHRPLPRRPLTQLAVMPSRPAAATVETAVVQPDHRIRLARTLELLGLDHDQHLEFGVEPDRVVLKVADVDTPPSRRLRVGTRGQVTLTPALRHALGVVPGDSTTVVCPEGAAEVWLVSAGAVAAGIDAVAAASPAALDLARHLPELSASGADLLLAVATRLSPAQLEALASCVPDRLDQVLTETADDAERTSA